MARRPVVQIVEPEVGLEYIGAPVVDTESEPHILAARPGRGRVPVRRRSGRVPPDRFDAEGGTDDDAAGDADAAAAAERDLHPAATAGQDLDAIRTRRDPLPRASLRVRRQDPPFPGGSRDPDLDVGTAPAGPVGRDDFEGAGLGRGVVAGGDRLALDLDVLDQVVIGRRGLCAGRDRARTDQQRGRQQQGDGVRP